MYASHHTVEDLQAFTSRKVPHPQWVRIKEETIADEHLDRAARILQEQLGPEGIRKVGGTKWWQWRTPGSALRAEWIEMRSHYRKRKRTVTVNGEAPPASKRVMFYVHGGAYYFSSVDEHRYQMQRHARKIGGRVFAPRYRLAPQFPFPCGLHDCLAAYLYLLTVQDPSNIVVAGDSAGGGMVVAMLVTLRDRGLPMPAGAVLISPWVDLTHSFPSLAEESPLDYIPRNGFHHKPSMAWPPPNSDEFRAIAERAAAVAAQAKQPDGSKSPDAPEMSQVAHRESPRDISVSIDGKVVVLKDQIQVRQTVSRNHVVRRLTKPSYM